MRMHSYGRWKLTGKVEWRMVRTGSLWWAKTECQMFVEESRTVTSHNYGTLCEQSKPDETRWRIMTEADSRNLITKNMGEIG